MSDELDPITPDPRTSPASDPLDELLIFGSVETRRRFLKKVAGTSAALTLGPRLIGLSNLRAANIATANNPTTMVDVQLKINGTVHKLRLDPRTSLLDLLRENLQLTGTKKGCDHGQCGACTVHVDGRRVNACLMLAVQAQGTKITTIEGLASEAALHPVQAAFIEHDGFNAAIALRARSCPRWRASGKATPKDDAQSREWMSGKHLPLRHLPGDRRSDQRGPRQDWR